MNLNSKRKCKICPKMFRPKNGNQTLCSPKCKKKNRKQYMAQRMKKWYYEQGGKKYHQDYNKRPEVRERIKMNYHAKKMKGGRE